jgi:hypothetical protein
VRRAALSGGKNPASTATRRHLLIEIKKQHSTLLLDGRGVRASSKEVAARGGGGGDRARKAVWYLFI